MKFSEIELAHHKALFTMHISLEHSVDQAVGSYCCVSYLHASTSPGDCVKSVIKVSQRYFGKSFQHNET